MAKETLKKSASTALSSAAAAAPHDKVPWHRDPKIRGLLAQTILLLLVVWGLWTIFNNTMHNLQVRGIQTGFGFLGEVAPFNVRFSPFIEFKLGESTYWQVFLIGIQNTIIVSLLGIIAATFLGFIIGVMRLSPNWFVSRFAALYIETFRNIPVLLQIMFWNFAIFLPLLPAPRNSLSAGDMVFLNKRGLYIPEFQLENTTVFAVLLAILVSGAIITWYLNRWAHHRQDDTGKRFPAKLTGLAGTLVVAALVMLILGSPFRLIAPELGRFNLRGGFELPLPLFSLWFSLTTYTASFIAENVRGGILSVSKGQTEAAQAVGLSRQHMLKLVIIPQAMRVIVPPTISQFLNLTKNSSLAVAIAYEEIVNLWAGISLNQTGQALIIIAMTIAVYESLSLLTSALLNFYNKRVQLVER